MQVVDTNSHVYITTNSVDPGQKPTDLDVHCLPKLAISWYNRNRIYVLPVRIFESGTRTVLAWCELLVLLTHIEMH